MTETFIQKARLIHGDKYEYSKVDYKKAIERVIIICKEHGEFWQTPNKHLGKSGCSKCSGVYKPTTNEFINNAILVHGDNYDYSKVKYIKAIEKVIIICKEHGEFEQTPNSHLNGSGCPFCGKTYKSDNQDFIKKAIAIHGDNYDYSKVEYKTAREKIIIICKTHGEFEQMASCHISGDGCRKCGFEKTSQQRNSNTIEFIQKAIMTHGDKYDYSKVNYTKARENVIIICKTHGEFEQTPNKHLRPSGCNNCAINNRADNCRSNTNEFIQKAIITHGDNYDYSKVDYIGNHNEINIICKEHGAFLQMPSVHLRGNGCQKCGGNFRYDTKEFIEKAIDVHGNKYDYSKSKYKKNNEKVIIICKEHGEFEQTPNSHLNGCGCSICKNEYIGSIKIKSNEQFIHDALEIHGDTYDYSNTEYEGCSVNVKIICGKHGVFEQTPNSHLNGHGCQKCCNCYTMTQNEFIEKSQCVHIDCNSQALFDYSQIKYVNNKTPVTIICKIHGEFSQIPYIHIKGHSCNKCSRNKISETCYKNNNFVNNAKKMHGDIYDYSKVDYKGCSVNVIIICKIHGEFEKTPDNHTHKTRPQGCQKCQTKKQYSKSQIEWLNFIQLYNNITIKHAENGNELSIQNTNYKADGYCEETNTIYEFHGDYWHGNPKKFMPIEINKTTGTTFGELYQKTLEREQQIKDFGYNLVVMWEHDWNKINKSILVLQRKFKSLH